MYLGISVLDIIYHNQIHQCFSLNLQVNLNEYKKLHEAQSIPLVRIPKLLIIILIIYVINLLLPVNH